MVSSEPELRQRAEAQLKTQQAEQSTANGLSGSERVQPSFEETQQQHHELEVHQIELEMQNEELRQSHINLNAARDRYFELYDLAPVGYLTLSEMGLIEEVNLTATTLLGTPKGALVARPLSKFISAADRDGFYLYLRKLLAADSPAATAAAGAVKPALICDDLRFVKADGTQFWGNLQGACLAGGVHSACATAAGKRQVVLTLMDITARKQAEAQVLQAKKEWELTFDAVPDLISIIDANHKILRVNQAMADKLHVTRDQAVGLTCYEHVHGTNCPPEVCPHAKLLADNQGHTSEICESRLGGNFLVSCTPVRDASGELLGSVHVARDINLHKQLEHKLLDSNQQLANTLAELRQTQSQIVQQEQLRGLGQMASGIAHDFNNALSPIAGFTELLLKDPAKRTDQELLVQWLTFINTAANDAAHVVRQLSEFSRQRSERVTLQPVNLNDLVLQTIELTRPRWKDQAQATGCAIHIVTDLQPVPIIAAEGASFRELLTNLIFNAVDAMPEGGTVALSTAVEGAFVCLRVRDTGTGMTEEVRRRCFEPFYTTKGVQGSGLGLAMVHGIVQRHSGTVSIASEMGHGTTITVRVPISTVHTAPKAPVAPVKLTQSHQVLVVDDEPLLCAVVEAFLNCDGHVVTTANSGTAALRLFEVGKFDLLITDKAMPDMNGEQLAASIHIREPNLPVVLMTGFGDEMKATGKMPPHIHAILSKPVTEDTLRAVLAKAVAG